MTEIYDKKKTIILHFALSSAATLHFAHAKTNNSAVYVCASDTAASFKRANKQ